MEQTAEQAGRQVKRVLTRDGIKVKGWLRRNRGILSRISRDLGISPQLVRAVAWGECHSAGRRIEALLREQGWPELLDRGWKEEVVDETEGDDSAKVS